MKDHIDVAHRSPGARIRACLYVAAVILAAGAVILVLDANLAPLSTWIFQVLQ